MNDHPTSMRQSVSMLILYILGSTVVLAPGRQAERDMWMAVIIAFLMALPLAFLYGRLIRIFPDKSLYDMQLEFFGPIFGRMMMLYTVITCFHLGALVTRNFSEYIKIVSFQESPIYFLALPIGLLGIWCVKAGKSMLGRWSLVVAPGFIVALVVAVLLSYALWDVENLFPILYGGIKPVGLGATDILAFPFMETILLAFVLKPLTPKSNAYKVFIIGYSVGAALLAMIYAVSTLVLSYEQVSKYYFPSHMVVSLINIGELFKGIEAIMVFIYLFGGFAKIFVCLFVATEGAAKLTGQGSKSLAAPVGLLMLTFSIFVSPNASEMYGWAAKYYKYYILPIGLFLPILMWIVAEVKLRKARNCDS